MSINNPIININNKIKYIIVGAFVLLLVVIGYFFLSKDKKGDQGGSGGGAVCKYGVDKNGKCKLAPTCYNKIPSLDCPDGTTLICDPIIQDFRCRLDKCESDTNPFPYNFKCDTSKINCDSNKRYYCDGECQNGGILYNGNSKCSCPKSFIGDKCNCDSSVCKGGEISSDCKKCTSCCNSNTSIDNKCNSYGDDCKETCPPNYVYDPTSTEINKCVCTGKCFKEEEKEDGSKICVQLNTTDCCKNGTITDGKCVCNDGWIGVKCDIPICGENGKWDDIQKKCICNTDTVGDNCEYSRDKFCSGNGRPYIFNGVPSCICDDGFSGEHCSCTNKNKPDELDIYKCEGINFKCEETSNGDGTYSGSWKENKMSCSEIFSQYGKEDGQSQWEKECTNQIYDFNTYPYPDYNATCINSSDGTAQFNISSKKCNSKPTDNDLKNCLNTEGCYVPWKKDWSSDDKNKTYSKTCICDETDNGTVYSCKNNEPNQCGVPTPDPNIYCSGGTPVCTICGGNTFGYYCNASSLPKDCVIFRNKLTPYNSNGVVWYSIKPQPDQTPIFPVVDINTCDYDTLLDNNYLQWSSLDNNNAGFVQGLNDPSFTKPVFYPYDDPNILSYNIKADIVQNSDPNNKPTTISLEPNPYPFNNNAQAKADQDLFFRDDNNKYRYQAGCAKLKNNKIDDNNIPKNSDNYTNCFGENGEFKQYCADESKNIVDCSIKNTPYYRTDKGYCKCNTYKSNAQDNKEVQYQGRYCQYNDNDTCNGKGIVNYSGNCNCNIKYCSQAQKTFVNYTGKNCNLDDNNLCSGLGIVDYNGNCDFKTPLQDLSKYSIVCDPLNNLADGDIVIIEWVTPIDATLSYITDIYTPDNHSNIDTLILSNNSPTIFKVGIINQSGNKLYNFKILNLDSTDIKNLYNFRSFSISFERYIATYDYYSYIVYYNNKEDPPEDLESTYYKMTTSLNNCYVSLTSSKTSTELQYNTQTKDFTKTNNKSYWRFHKFNAPLNPTTCSL